MICRKKILCIIHSRTLHRSKIKIPPRPPLAKGGWGDLVAIAFISGFAFLFAVLSGCNYARMNDQESVRTYEKEIPEMDLSQKLENVDRLAISAALPKGTALIEFVRFWPAKLKAIPGKNDAQWAPARYLAFSLRVPRTVPCRSVRRARATRSPAAAPD